VKRAPNWGVARRRRPARPLAAAAATPNGGAAPPVLSTVSFFPFAFVLFARVSRIRDIPTKRGELVRSAWRARAPLARCARPARARTETERERGARPVCFLRAARAARRGRETRARARPRHGSTPWLLAAALWLARVGQGGGRRGQRETERHGASAPPLCLSLSHTERPSVHLLFSVSRARLSRSRQNQWRHSLSILAPVLTPHSPPTHSALASSFSNKKNTLKKKTAATGTNSLKPRKKQQHPAP
jgi:hypothetical protein